MKNEVSIRSESSEGGGERMLLVPMQRAGSICFLHMRPWMLISKPHAIYTKPRRQTPQMW